MCLAPAPRRVGAPPLPRPAVRARRRPIPPGVAAQPPPLRLAAGAPPPLPPAAAVQALPVPAAAALFSAPAPPRLAAVASPRQLRPPAWLPEPAAAAFPQPHRPAAWPLRLSAVRRAALELSGLLPLCGVRRLWRAGDFLPPGAFL